MREVLLGSEPFLIRPQRDRRRERPIGVDLSPREPAVDFVAKRNKIDWLCQERLGTPFPYVSLGTFIAIGSFRDHRDPGRAAFRHR